MQIEGLPYKLDLDTLLCRMLHDSRFLHHTQSLVAAKGQDEATRKLQEEISEKGHSKHVDGHFRLLNRAALLTRIEYKSLHLAIRLWVSSEQAGLERLPLDFHESDTVLGLGIPAYLPILATRPDKSTSQVMWMLQEKSASSPEKYAKRRPKVGIIEW